MNRRRPAARELSARELEVLAHVALGVPSKRIGPILGVSFKTIEAHRSNIRWKTGAKNVADLVRYFYTHCIPARHCPGCRCGQHRTPVLSDGEHVPY